MCFCKWFSYTMDTRCGMIRTLAPKEKSFTSSTSRALWKRTILLINMNAWFETKGNSILQVFSCSLSVNIFTSRNKVNVNRQRKNKQIEIEHTHISTVEIDKFHKHLKQWLVVEISVILSAVLGSKHYNWIH